MSITFDQALNSRVFHATLNCPCEAKAGPARWRRNGVTKTWKTRPTEFRIPVKFGMYAYDYITDQTTGVHAAEDCPVESQRY